LFTTMLSDSSVPYIDTCPTVYFIIF